MAALISKSYIAGLTGLSQSIISDDIIALAEAKAKELLGYYATATLLKTFVVLNPTSYFDIDTAGATITKVEYRVASGAFTEIFSDAYRHIADKKLLILDAATAANTELKVTMAVGWTTGTLPTLVKLLVSILVIDLINNFTPGTFNTNTIKSTKIGDYAVTYDLTGVAGGSNVFSQESIDRLVTLIKSGASDPYSTI